MMMKVDNALNLPLHRLTQSSSSPVSTCNVSPLKGGDDQSLGNFKRSGGKSLHKTFTVNLSPNRRRWQKAWQCTNLPTTHRNSSKLEKQNQQVLAMRHPWKVAMADVCRTSKRRRRKAQTGPHRQPTQIRRGDRKLDSTIAYLLLTESQSSRKPSNFACTMAPLEGRQ